MRYKAKSIAALQLTLGSLGGIGHRSVGKDVGDLRKVTAWSANLGITTPSDGDPESAIRVSRVNAATRVSPKP